MIIDKLIEFSYREHHYGIEIQEVEKYKDILGENLYSKLLETIKQRLLEKVEFNKSYFEILLEQS